MFSLRISAYLTTNENSNVIEYELNSIYFMYVFHFDFSFFLCIGICFPFSFYVLEKYRKIEEFF
jgi:hypothetical protein